MPLGWVISNPPLLKRISSSKFLYLNSGTNGDSVVACTLQFPMLLLLLHDSSTGPSPLVCLYSLTAFAIMVFQFKNHLLAFQLWFKSKPFACFSIMVFQFKNHYFLACLKHGLIIQNHLLIFQIWFKSKPFAYFSNMV